MQLLIVMIVTNMPQGGSLWWKHDLRFPESTKKFSTIAVKKVAQKCVNQDRKDLLCISLGLPDTCEQCEWEEGNWKLSSDNGRHLSANTNVTYSNTNTNKYKK